MRLALFDLDNTLLGGDSDHAWGDYLCERGFLDPVAYKQRNDEFYQDYLAGKLDNAAYLNFCLEVLGRTEMATLDQPFPSVMTVPVRFRSRRRRGSGRARASRGPVR